MKYLILGAVVVLSALSAAHATPAVSPEKAAAARPAAQPSAKAVLALLDTQVAAWNRGDLPAFCSAYADDALFISPTGLTRSRAAVLARYTKRYPDKAAMGELALETVETRATADAVSVAARWTLRYPGKPAATGHTLIVFRMIEKRWQIVQDASM